MASEQFSLSWDNFHKNMSSGIQSLLENEDLVDVTLAVEGRYLKAHKMILSVCSPYFRELFQSNPCKHPIVFMKDVSYIALSDLLQFMYQGEVQVSQENLPAFIKTAEALQVKGLTADMAIPDPESVDQLETNKKVIEMPTKRSYESATTKTTAMSRVKRLAGPATKRIKVSESSIGVSPSIPQTKTEIASAISATPAENSSIQFKLEPSELASDQTPMEEIDEGQVEQYVDESILDEGQEDTEEYSLMESADEDPRPGTSTEETGNDQDPYLISTQTKRKKRITSRMRFIVDGFVYHSNLISGTPPLRYLGCAEHKKAGCRGRATLPVNGTLDQLKITQEHNHPPDITAAEKDTFVSELKNAVCSMRKAPLKNIYEAVAEIYPVGAAEIPFRSISSSLHRWRQNANL